VGRCPLEVNDLVVLFTDGLYEVPGSAGEEFGQERLLAAVRQRAQLAPSDLFDELLLEVKEFSSHKEFEDDVCLIGMEIGELDGILGP